MITFLNAVASQRPIEFYSDGYFDLAHAPLGDALMESRRNLTLQHGRAATGVYTYRQRAPAQHMQCNF
jgi:hypothetical protein